MKETIEKIKQLIYEQEKQGVIITDIKLEVKRSTIIEKIGVSLTCEGVADKKYYDSPEESMRKWREAFAGVKEIIQDLNTLKTKRKPFETGGFIAPQESEKIISGLKGHIADVFETDLLTKISKLTPFTRSDVQSFMLVSGVKSDKIQQLMVDLSKAGVNNLAEVINLCKLGYCKFD